MALDTPHSVLRCAAWHSTVFPQTGKTVSLHFLNLLLWVSITTPSPPVGQTWIFTNFVQVEHQCLQIFQSTSVHVDIMSVSLSWSCRKPWSVSYFIATLVFGQNFSYITIYIYHLNGFCHTDMSPMNLEFGRPTPIVVESICAWRQKLSGPVLPAWGGVSISSNICCWYFNTNQKISIFFLRSNKKIKSV